MLRRTASLSKYLQMIGRAFRVHDSKEFGVILDHVNNISIHGLPDDDRTWSLNGKISKPQESKEIVNIKQCTQCFYVFKPQPVCPNCGFEYIPEPLKVDFIDTTLIEIERIEKKAKTIEVNKARSLDELKLIAKQRGYKPAWALIKFKSRKHYTKGAST